MNVLVVNAGSSTLKLSLLDADDRLVASTVVDQRAGEGDLTGLASFLTGAGAVDAVGHRVVHGGTEFRAPVLVDANVESAIEALTSLAPLHQPRALAGLRAVHRVLPDVPAVAAFDTAFHATLPPAAATYALPAEWNERWGLRRYGFHGLSHAYAARRAAQFVRPASPALTGPLGPAGIPGGRPPGSGW